MTTDVSSLQDLARKHLWMHFTRMGAYVDQEIPVIVRGEGCHVYDERGNRYLDGLSALFCVNLGHGRADLVQAGADQAADLGFYSNWSYAHPRAVELAAKVAELAPDGLDRVFFTNGGAESVEGALKLCRQYHVLNGEPERYKVIARHIAYHGVTMGAMSVTGIDDLKEPFAPYLIPGVSHVPNTDLYRLPEGMREEDLAETIRDRILEEGPETVSAVILEPVQNAGGCLMPPPGYFQRVREICDEFGVLFISDDTICSWGRLGTWFGAQKFDYVPDVITTAKAITSAYAPMGAVIASEKLFEPFSKGTTTYLHGSTFGGHPVCAAIALAAIRAYEDEGILERVDTHAPQFRAMLDSLRDIPIVGDVRGTGYFHSIELVKDRATKETFDEHDSEWLLRDFLSGMLFKLGLVCRADDRGDPVIQLAPPLIAGPEEFAEIESVLRPVLTEASERLGLH